ncbi:MAG: MlaD family protein, partial [Candidatus Obscuribacterales bacterium]
MELSPKISAQVGLFVMTAACMLLFGWSWLKGLSIMHPPQRFIAQFHDVAGLNNNAPVNINGVRIGQVEQIDLKGKGQVLVHLKISSEDITIPKGSAITIQTQGLVGAKYIEITLPETKQGESPPAIEPGAIVMGQDPVRLELIANKIATKLNHLVTDVGGDDVGISLAEALRHSGETVHNINEAAKKLNSNMDTLKVASENFSTTSTKVGQVADSYRNVSTGANTFFTKSSRTAESINVLAGNLTTTSKRLNKVLENPGF